MSEDSKNSSMLANIYREVGESKVTLQNVDNKLDSHIQETKEELRRINALDDEQNRILDKHIEGVNTLKDMHLAHRIETIEQIQLLKESLDVQKDEAAKRIEALEKPHELIKYIGKVIMWVGSIAVAIAGIVQLLKSF
jgi:hypothetical protein